MTARRPAPAPLLRRLPRRRVALRAIGGILLTLGVVAPARSARAVERLEPGVPLTREIGAGETHTIPFEIGAGELVEALVAQQGADVTIELVEPGGAAALETNIQDDPMRLERVLWIARVSGAHALRVHAAPARPGGRYRVVLEPPRPATASDAKRVAAQRALEVAGRLGRKDAAGALARQREQLEEALAEFRSAADRRGEASALEELADLEVDLSRAAQALPRAREALALYRELQDRPAEATALDRVGFASQWAGDPRSGLEPLLAAIQLARELSNPWREAIALNKVGSIYKRSGDAEAAIEWHLQAVARSRAAGHRPNEAYSLNNLGIAYKELGEFERALACYEQIVERFQALKDVAAEARTYNNMGNVYKLMGDNQRARELFLRYLALARQRSPGGDDEARALNNLAAVQHLLGSYPEALENARRSLAIRQARGDRPGAASALHNIGENLGKLGESEAALASLREALGIRRGLGERYVEADTLMAIAAVERDRGNLREALAQSEAAVSLTEALRSEVTDPDLRASFVAAEQDKYGFHVDLLMRLHEQDPEGGHDAAALQAGERALARVLLDALVAARADIREGIEASLLDRERALQRQLALARERLSRLQVRGGAAEDVARAREELETRAREYRELQGRIREQSPRYAALTQPVPASLEEIRREVLDEDTVLLEFHLGDRRGFLWAATPTVLVSHALPGRATVEAAARTLHRLFTERQRSRAPAAIRSADDRLAEVSAETSRLVLGGVAQRLATDWKGKRLVFVVSGALAYLPFAALPLPSGPEARPLVRHHEIVLAPSASVLLALRRESAARRPPGTDVAVLADPVFDAADPRVRRGRAPGAVDRAALSPALTRASAGLEGVGLGRLPFSRAEADAIATFVPRSALLRATDFDASRALVASGSLAGRRLVHFATHGLINSEHPDLSGLVLSLVDEAGAPRDGFLRMHEIFNLRLPADMVVLSACQTALGREIRGEGLIGLTRGFMYAGARRVVASLWQVDDESTAELMKRFYRALLQEDRRPADALRVAQIEMAKHPRWSPPFYWAGFTLQGEWR